MRLKQLCFAKAAQLIAPASLHILVTACSKPSLLLQQNSMNIAMLDTLMPPHHVP